ncbi:MAG: pyruvate kinase [Defluviitaleaceae bacterium]|nr:pyruvate kinase [Defluviitaleaceae bacterium]MCL2835205.1 pyruvate kinase [Defluviitaleaceae bacterium]
MHKTKIICTIGPASEKPEIMRELILGGMNVARLNFSHGTHPEHLAKIEALKKLREELKRPVAILADTKGPEIRVRTFEKGKVNLEVGAEFTLTTRDVPGTKEIVSVTYEGLPGNVEKGTKVMLDDGLIELRVEEVKGSDILCRVIYGGELKNRKSLNLPGVSVDMPYLSETDKADLTFAYENDADYIALSFVRSAEDVFLAQNFLAGLGPIRCQLISKIENAEGVENIDEIIRVSDGIMVARGDMGVEIPFEELPGIQKTLIKKCYRAGKKVITATHMLESMINNPRPTRAEITDIANAIYDGTSALMLSGETAGGKYPVESLKTMVKIAQQTEENIDYREQFRGYNAKIEHNITDAISHAACSAAHDLGAVAIVTVTVNGTAARMISRYRPCVRIIAVTPKFKTYQQMAMSWGVVPLLSEYHEESGAVYRNAAEKVLESGHAAEGDIIVVTGSSSQQSSVTNMVQVLVLGDTIVKGVGHGMQSVGSKACVISRRKESAEFVDGCVIVIDKTTKEALRLLRRAVAVVTEEEFGASGIAAAAVAMDIPLITGAEDATKLISDGSSITVDPVCGTVYNRN